MDPLAVLNDQFLSCNLCMEIFKDPCTIGCYHTFCRECLARYTKTRRDAISAKSIPCPNCRQMTKVPRPQEPVERWCQQFKPSFLIQGLLDTFTSQESSCQETVQHCCFTCQQIGKTSQATSVCHDCDIILCETCVQMHTVTPMLSGHVVSPLTKSSKKRKVMCEEHNSLIEFCCRDCQKAVCNECCNIYHNKCHSVVTIHSMIPEMKSILQKHGGEINLKLTEIGIRLKNQRSQVKKSYEDRISLESEIRRASQEAVDLIRQNEKKLLDELGKLTEEQAGQLRGQIKSGEIDQQTYQQYSEFIKQVLQSESPMDLYDMYVMCQSGEITREHERNQTHVKNAKKLTFKKEFDVSQMNTSFQLGHVSVDGEDFYQHCTSADNSRTSGNELHLSATEISALNLKDVEVLSIDSTDTVVVTDANSCSIKSYYRKEGQTYCKSLKLRQEPLRVTKLGKDEIVISFWSNNILERIQVTPDPVHLSIISTQKRYRCLTALSDQTLAAGCGNPLSIDILDLSGKVLRSVITPSTYQQLIQNPWYMCTTHQGHILVSDVGSESVYCLTQFGEVVFMYQLKGGGGRGGWGGITTTDTGMAIVADFHNKKILQLNENGGYVRDLLTERDGIEEPQGMCLHKTKLYVTTYRCGIVVFELDFS